MTIKHELRKFLWKFGYDIYKLTPQNNPLLKRKQLFESYNIDMVLDIGANAGQYASQLRSKVGYKGDILSFEPLSTAFAKLKDNASNDTSWQVFNMAIGDMEELKEINIAGNSYSSSFLNMLPSHLKSAPKSRYIGKEKIEIKPLDIIFGELCKSAKNIYMKIDTQGYESKVIKGAETSLPLINTIQMEMSLVPLYDGELLFHEMCALMSNKGYTLVALENGFSDPGTGQLLQVDGIFHRM